MRIWLITVGEPLPIDGPDTRRLRTGFLFRALSRRGHAVTWFTNRFDHFTKRHRPGPSTIELSDFERIVLLESRGYRSNVSIERYLDHRDLAESFVQWAEREPVPALIIASMPTIELAEAAASYARRNGIPCVIDIRDLWPDSIWDLAPFLVRPVVRLLTKPLEKRLRAALSQATALMSHVEAFIDWGIAKTARSRGAYDQAFPLGYEALPAGAHSSEARAFWKDRGIDLAIDDFFLVVYAGTISRQCEFEHVIAAARELSEDRVRFVLCGSGDLLTKLQHDASDAPNVLIPGWCTHAQISVLLERADAGLMPYRRFKNFEDAVPNKALEYMASGVPIVWSLERGALAEVLHTEKVGVTYDLSANGLVAALKGIRARHLESSDISARSKALFAKKYQAANVYDSMVSFLESLVAEGPR
jgi:glycosyltransferase involved in cell wall biosynthesis